jgi:hypothetical protein
MVCVSSSKRIDGADHVIAFDMQVAHHLSVPSRATLHRARQRARHNQQQRHPVAQQWHRTKHTGDLLRREYSRQGLPLARLDLVKTKFLLLQLPRSGFVQPVEAGQPDNPPVKL